MFSYSPCPNPQCRRGAVPLVFAGLVISSECPDCKGKGYVTSCHLSPVTCHPSRECAPGGLAGVMTNFFQHMIQ